MFEILILISIFGVLAAIRAIFAHKKERNRNLKNLKEFERRYPGKNNQRR